MMKSILIGAVLLAASIIPAFADAGQYGDIAASIWQDNNGAWHVVTGMATRETPGQAARAAIAACEGNGRSRLCPCPK